MSTADDALANAVKGYQTIKVRKASAAYVEKVGVYIQDNTDNAAWTAARLLLAEARYQQHMGEFDAARRHVDEAFRAAFPGREPSEITA